MRWLWALLVVVMFVFPISGHAQQPMFFEGEVSAIVAKNSMTLSGDTDINLQEIGLSKNSVLKSFSFVASLNPDLRIRYTCVLPYQDSARGQLMQQVTLNGITYGPKDSNDTQNRDIFTQYKFTDHRVEIDFLPFIKQSNAQIYFVGSVEFALTNFSLKGKPNQSGGTGGTTSNDPIETSVSANKTLLGVGLGGYQRQRNVLFKYKIVYDFLNGGRGWLAEADLRYIIDQRGFAGVAYYHEDLNMPLDIFRIKNRFDGIAFKVGLLF